jgi:3-hydroxyisobutyrate dehydrogenase-like beta-hydroxyacid dehydrogenase
MGGGVVQSLVRAGFPTVVRDIRPRAQDAAVRHGASAADSPADLARRCDVVIILVVDALEVETVLFGVDGAAAALIPGTVVLASSTVDPVRPGQWVPRVARFGAALLDAPVSGGPARAAAGTMTMMVSGDPAAQERVRPVLAAISDRLFALGPRAGDASAFKVVNNLLAAANLAAGAEARALAHAMGLDLALVADVIGASSGGSWIFADRVPRALADDFAPRAAAKILAKDIGIAVALAQRLGVDATFAHAAQAALAEALAGGDGEADDAVLVRRALQRMRTMPRAQ